MSRIASHSGLILMVLALPAFAQKSTVYKSPQDCFDAGSTAFTKSDHKTWVGCLAPESQKELAVEFVVKFAVARAAIAELKDKDQKAAAAKAHKPLFAVLDNHKLSLEATKDVKQGKSKDERDKVRKVILALLKDPEAFLVDFYEAMEKLDNLTKDKDNVTEELKGVKIDGDTASATLVRTVKDKKGKEEKVRFVKVGGGWRLLLRFGPDAPKED